MIRGKSNAVSEVGCILCYFYVAMTSILHKLIRMLGHSAIDKEKKADNTRGSHAT